MRPVPFDGPPATFRVPVRPRRPRSSRRHRVDPGGVIGACASSQVDAVHRAPSHRASTRVSPPRSSSRGGQARLPMRGPVCVRALASRGHERVAATRVAPAPTQFIHAPNIRVAGSSNPSSTSVGSVTATTASLGPRRTKLRSHSRKVGQGVLRQRCTCRGSALGPFLLEVRGRSERWTAPVAVWHDPCLLPVPWMDRRSLDGVPSDIRRPAAR